MDLERVFSCRAKVYSKCRHGHLTPIGAESWLTINYVRDHAPPLLVYDEHRQMVVMRLPEATVTRYTVLSLFRHEISRYNDSIIVLEFYQEDEDDVKMFTKIMEDVHRGINRFSSQSEVSHSHSSGSEDEREHNGAAAAWPPSTVGGHNPTYWDCTNCRFACSNEHGWRCGECSSLREVNLKFEWQCRCRRVYGTCVAECKLCRMWRCQWCTFHNVPNSPHQCSACGKDRWR